MNELDKLKDFINTYYSINACYPAPTAILKQIDLIKSGRPQAMPEHLYKQSKVEIGTLYHDLTAINRMGVTDSSLYFFIGEEMHYQNFVDDFTRKQAEDILDLWRCL